MLKNSILVARPSITGWIKTIFMPLASGMFLPMSTLNESTTEIAIGLSDPSEMII